MQIKRRYSSRKKVVLVALAVVLLAGLTAGTLYALKIGPFARSNDEVNKIDLSEPSEDAKDAGSTVKEQTLTTGDAKPGSTSDRATAPEAEAGSKADSGLRITSSTQTEDDYIVRTLIPVFTGQGTCELSMEGPNGKLYSASVSVQAMASSSTCAGFNIPLSQLTPGKWSVSIVLNNENLSGSDTSEVVIK